MDAETKPTCPGSGKPGTWKRHPRCYEHEWFCDQCAFRVASATDGLMPEHSEQAPEIASATPMTHAELEMKLLEAIDRVTKLEGEIKRLDAEVLKADACPQCGGRPGRMCITCNGTGRRSGGKRR